MDLDEVDDAVTVWVARVDTRDGETIVTAWSMHDSAEVWCAHELGASTMTWDETRGSGPGKRLEGYAAGTHCATIQQVELMDPVELSRQYPLEMPAAPDCERD
jgi:hypothetical protein